MSNTDEAATSRKTDSSDPARSGVGKRLTGRRSFLAAASAVTASIAGCGSNSSSSDSGPIKLGAIVPLPGQFAGGTGEANAYKLLTKQINDDGGLLGREVQMSVKDSKLKASVTQEKYRELVLKEGARATFGGFADEGLLRILPDVAEQKKIYIAPSGAVMDPYQKVQNEYDKYKYFFSTFQNGHIIGTNLANFAKQNFVDQMGWEKIGFVIEDITGWDPIVEIPLNQPPNGVEVAFKQKFSADTKDFGPILDKAEQANVDGLYSFMSRGGIPLTTQWSKRQPDFGIGGGDIFSSNPSHYENTSGAVEKVWTYLGGAAPNVQPTQTTGEFIDAYEKEYGGPPPHAQSYTAYDSMLAYVKAVEKAGTLDEEKVIPELEKIEFAGATGTINFYPPDHKWAHNPRYGEEYVMPPIIQWQDGEQVALWPDKLENGKYKPPAWI